MYSIIRHSAPVRHFIRINIQSRTVGAGTGNETAASSHTEIVTALYDHELYLEESGELVTI